MDRTAGRVGSGLEILTRVQLSLTTDKLSAVSYDPLSHSRHNAGDRRAKVGHEISLVRLFLAA